MQKYKDLSEKLKKIEYKLGVSYVKTSHPAYKRLRILNTICVIYLFVINLLILLSEYLNEKHSNKYYFSKTECILIIAGTLFEVAGLIFNKYKRHIVGNILNIIPLPYFTCLFASKLNNYPDGFFGYQNQFYYRHFASYVFILIFSFAMLFIAVRQQVKTRKLYKRILENIYEEYKKKNGEGDFSISEEDWDKYIKNFDPRKNKIKF